MDKVTLRLDGKIYTVDADPHSFVAAELNAVERNTGMTVGEWAEKLQDRGGSSLAWTALAWIAKRRAGEFVKWRDFEDDLNVMELIEGVQMPGVEPADSST